jgi:hypothetical protein
MTIGNLYRRWRVRYATLRLTRPTSDACSYENRLSFSCAVRPGAAIQKHPIVAATMTMTAA